MNPLPSLSATTSASATVPATTFKVVVGDDVRRFTLLTTTLTFAEVSKVCGELFNVAPPLTLGWYDADGDRITIQTDTDVDEALAAAKPKVLKLIMATCTATPLPPTVSDTKQGKQEAKARKQHEKKEKRTAKQEEATKKKKKKSSKQGTTADSLATTCTCTTTNEPMSTPTTNSAPNTTTTAAAATTTTSATAATTEPREPLPMFVDLASAIEYGKQAAVQLLPYLKEMAAAATAEAKQAPKAALAAGTTRARSQCEVRCEAATTHCKMVKEECSARMAKATELVNHTKVALQTFKKTMQMFKEDIKRTTAAAATDTDQGQQQQQAIKPDQTIAPSTVNGQGSTTSVVQAEPPLHPQLPAASVASVPAGPRILRAWYGDPNEVATPNSARGLDVTAKCELILASSSCVSASNAVFGDPCVGCRKMLVVEYSAAHSATDSTVIKAWENTTLDLEMIPTC